MFLTAAGLGVSGAGTAAARFPGRRLLRRERTGKERRKEKWGGKKINNKKKTIKE